MDHGIDFLQDLAVVMVVAGLTTVFFHRLKQPVVLGYMLAGLLIGPHTPPFPLIKHQESIKTLAELGIIFLMFRMGLHFSLRKLLSMGAAAFLAASFEITLMVSLGYHIGRWFGWSTMDSIFLGAMLSISSTTIIVKTLTDLKMINEKWINLIFAILIGEDLLAVAILAMLPALATSGSMPISEVIHAIIQLAVFLTVALVVGLILIPKILKFVSKYKEDEMLLVTVLGLVFGLSLMAAVLGYSVALGAFLVGAIMAETKEAGKIESVIAPLRDMFSAVFFVAVGMLIKPELLVSHTLPIVIITLTVIFGKIVACSTGAILAGNDTLSSLRVGMGLAQIGEFSFIIAQMGLALGVIGDFIYSIIVTVSALTAFTTPYLIKNSEPLSRLINSRAPVRVADAVTSYRNSLKWFREGSFAKDERMKRMRKLIIQFVLNILLITGIFVIAAWANEKNLLAHIVNSRDLEAWSAWLGAMIIVMPIVIGSLRKLNKISLIIIEKAQENASNFGKKFFAGLFEGVVQIVGILGLLYWILILSLTIVPQWHTLVLLIFIATLVGYLFRGPLLELYRKGQETLHHTLTEDHTPLPVKSPEVFGSLFKETILEKVSLLDGYYAVGKLIRELHLRSKVGVAIVGIERNEGGVVNPGPDEEICKDDIVLVLGSTEQIRKARQYLEKGD